MHDLYLVVEVPEGVLVIDQHALHERVLYEQLQERFHRGALESQRLLIPEPVELTAAQAALVLGQRAALAELGLEVGEFGGSTVLLHSYPAALGKRGPEEVPAKLLEAGAGGCESRENPTVPRGAGTVPDRSGLP